MDPYTVRAEFSFKGENNDELCFRKGDVITVTQREDGGWWEGTLSDKTGWFPSNYVAEFKAPLPLSETIRPPQEVQASRSVVLNDLHESETAHVAEIRGLLENFLEPLATSQILNADEYTQLMCNFVEIVVMHEELLQSIEDCNDRVGKLFLTKAPAIKVAHQAYCASHPRAIVILDKYKDELQSFMERQGSATPGLLVLTTGLSKPFRRLDKYSAMLQELERHMESGHPDRGDTQRGVAIYKEIAASCSAIRRQKELELQVLTGPVRGWQGQELSALGDIIHMGSVAVGPEHRDRYFVLFPQTLVILSVSHRMSAFIYEGKLPLTGINVNRLEDTDAIKNAFEIYSPLIEKIVAVCQGPNEANKWVDLLTFSNGVAPGGLQRQKSDLKYNATSSAINVPQLPPHRSPPVHGGNSQPMRNTPPTPLPQHKRSLSFNHHLNSKQQNNFNKLSQIPMREKSLGQQPMQLTPLHATGGGGRTSIKANWSISNLRPAPPLRPAILCHHASGTNASGAGGGTSGASLGNCTGGSGGSSSSVSANGVLSSYLSRKNQPTYEEDALVLRVIEAYCAAYQNTSRNTVHSALQPWTPCLPIRGGKLKTTKHFSSSNPQLPFMCTTSNSFVNNRNHSSSSLNTSYIWREASPNNFNLYSASISSLNTYRYSLGAAGVPEWRAASEEKSPQKHNNKMYNRNNHSENSGSNLTPLLPRKTKHNIRIWKGGSQSAHATPTHTRYRDEKHTVMPMMMTDVLMEPQQQHHQLPTASTTTTTTTQMGGGRQPSLYNRRMNRSFESPHDLKTTPLRRSTPHLVAGGDHDFVGDTASSSRHSATWCCGNFVMKQWRKMNNYE